MNIASKREAYRLFQSGAFGNKLRSWDNVRDFVYSDYQGTVSMRYKGTVTGKAWVAYNVHRDQVTTVAKHWISEGADPLLIVVNESAPDERLTIQGELMSSDRGLAFFYSTEPTKMRIALERGIQAVGLKVTMLLRKYCTPSSYDDLMELLQLYPGSVIEFSVYKMCLGDCRGRNAVVWEVRNY